MPMGPGGMNQSGPPPQPPHGHNMPSDGMVSGGPPAPHMQNQMNGQMPGEWTLSLKFPSLVISSFFPSSLSHLGCLATPQKCEGGRSTERWCHRFSSFGGPGPVVLCSSAQFSYSTVNIIGCNLKQLCHDMMSILYLRQIDYDQWH